MYLEIAKKIADLATDGGNAIVAAANGLSAINKLLDRPKSDGDVELKLAVSELALKIADANQANASLKSEITDLRDALRQANTFDRQIERYALHQTEGGAIIYKLKEALTDGEPVHYLCYRCAENRKRMILQHNDTYVTADCPECRTQYQIDKSGPPVVWL